MVISLEVKNIHDLIMLDTIIDMWKDKWKSEEPEEVEDDDAEDESEDRDDESAEDDDDAEEKAHRKALDALAKCLRDSGIADVSYTYLGHADRRNDRK